MASTRLHLLTGRGWAVVAALSSAPAVVLLLGSGDAHNPAVVSAVEVISYALVLGAAALAYFHWRSASVSQDDELGVRLAAWLTVGLTAGATIGLLQGAPFEVNDLDTGRWSMVSQLVLLILLGLVTAMADRIEVRTDPAVIGGVLAAVITTAYCLAVRVGPPLVLSATETALLNTAVMVAGLTLAWILLTRTEISLWARQRFAVGAVLITGAQCASNLDSYHSALMAAAMAAFLLGALCLCLMTHRLMRQSLVAHQTEIDGLTRSLSEVRAAVLEERQLLHEVGATLAGITNASQVMRQGHAVPSHRRRRLESMLTAELARLERLMHARAGGSSLCEGDDIEIDIDEVVESIVVSHQARGREVSWNGCGERSLVDRDELAEVVNILLENAARHGGRGVIRLSVSSVDDSVVVVCSDSGPGVAPELRARLFEPEVRRAGSPGQGLGLAIAQQLTSARGGSLELVDVDRPGATFVARLPGKKLVHGAADHVA